MRNLRAGWLVVAALFSLGGAALAQVMPGGMAGGYFGAPGSASTLEIVQRVDRDPGLEPYFWATQFWVDTTIDHGGYFGMQTNGIADGRLVGKMFIFSIWNASAAEPGPGAVAVPFGGEGIGYSLRMPHEWQEGEDYRFRLVREQGLWWRLRVSGPGLDADLGRIRVTQEAALRNTVANFTEYYQDVAACDRVPPARARFFGMVYGAAAGTAYGAHAYGNCAQIAAATLDGGALVHTIAGGLPAVPASLSGSWFDPGTSGQGFSLEMIDADRFILFYYGFGNAGEQLWLYGDYQQASPGFAFGQAVEVPLYFTTGTRWAPFDPGAIRRETWGSATFTFQDCRTASVVLSGTTGNQTLALQKLITPRGLACD